MAKAKYKLGTLVEIEGEIGGDVQYGEITAVITKPTGYSYILADLHTVTESEIKNAYKPFVQKRRRVAKKKIEETV